MKPNSPSSERNQAPILEALRPHFASCRHVLEIGSGTGQHAVHFAPALPSTIWQTSDVEGALPGIRMWLDEAALPNLPSPVVLDVNGQWPLARFDAAFTANTLHIIGWPELEKLFAGLDRVLEVSALLAVYGPFNYGGQFTSDSNRAFDDWLKWQSPVSGVRDFEAVDELANAVGLGLLPITQCRQTTGFWCGDERARPTLAQSRRNDAQDRRFRRARTQGVRLSAAV